MTQYCIKNYEKEVWRTISVVSIDGEPYAYQQKRVVGRPMYKNDGSIASTNNTFGSVMVDTDEHRFVPVAETVSEEEAKNVVEGFK